MLVMTEGLLEAFTDFALHQGISFWLHTSHELGEDFHEFMCYFQYLVFCISVVKGGAGAPGRRLSLVKQHMR